MTIKSQILNPNGFHGKYYIQKIIRVANPNFSPTAKQSQVINNHDQFILKLAEVDEDAEYFVLRLDNEAGDKEHLKACRIAVNAYADSIQAYLPQLAKELRERYPLI